MRKKLFIVLSDCWYGGPGPPIWVCTCVRETVGVWCLGLSLPPPTGLGSPSLTFVALRLRQSIGPLQPSGCGYRPLACLSCAPHSRVSAVGSLGLQDWDQGVQLLGLLG